MFSYHSLRSQLALTATNHMIYDQSTPHTSLCPFECARKLTRHTVIEDNEINLLSGVGLYGEGFFYMGHADSNQGFSRYAHIDGTALFRQPGRVLHTLHMSHNVTLEECDVIVRRHELLAPHAVWLINQDAEAKLADAERVGDCGLFLGARSIPSTQLWRAFYEYARFVTRLGHFETFIDSDIMVANVHTASEGPCTGGRSRVCVWWSEFDLDEYVYSQFYANRTARHTSTSQWFSTLHCPCTGVARSATPPTS